MQDVKAASDELRRCVRELGFKGAMINHQTNGIYLDDPRYEPFWEVVQELDVPLYLHPDNAYEKPHVLRGCPELDKATWEWTTECASHALRLVVSVCSIGIQGCALFSGIWAKRCPTCSGGSTAATPKPRRTAD
jgi:2,3-dihydroxybenzoate decarboxylase